MAVSLRPSSLGEILDHTAQLYREHFILFAGISAAYAGLLLVLNLAEIGAESVLHAMHLVQAERLFTGLAILVSLLAAFIAAGISVAANNRAVSWLSLGKPATIRGAYGNVLPQAGRYLWLLTLTALIVWVPAVLVYGGYVTFAVSFAHQAGSFTPQGVPARPESMTGFVVGSGIFLLLMIPAGVYAIWMTLRYALAVPACVMENLKARRAMRRSVELSKGSRGRIFVLGLLVVALQFGLLLLTQTFFVVAQFRHPGNLPAWLRVMQQIVAFFTNTFIGPIYATGLTLFYFDQRVRKEGYDIEQMMEAAGLSAGAEAATPAGDA